jgi:site-specific DNA-methyltransferase (adenine-specific)
MISSGDLVAEDSYLRIIPRSEKLHGRHLTQKPLRLVWQSLLASTCEGDLAYHSSCGSVTTSVAAKELDRFFVGAEMDG